MFRAGHRAVLQKKRPNTVLSSSLSLPPPCNDKSDKDIYVHKYQCTCQSRTKLYLTKSVHDRRVIFKYNVQHQRQRPISHFTFNDSQTLKPSGPMVATLHLNVVSCCLSIYVLYICIIKKNKIKKKKVQPKNILNATPYTMQQGRIQALVSNHYQNSQSVREMTKATLFDSFSVSQQNETSFVADCADSPRCLFLKLINEPFKELRNQEEREGRGRVGDTVFHFQEKKLLQTHK